MQHTIEDLIKRINVMHEKAIELHRVRNQYSELSDKTYDKQYCRILVEDIQSLALGIAMDKEGDDVKTEMDKWKYTQKQEVDEPVQERYYEWMGRKLREVR